MTEKKKSSYRDYVFSEGRFVGAFEDMYRDAPGVPWHQDESAGWLFSDVTLAVLKHHPFTSLCELGCGLGYFAERIRTEIPPGTQRLCGVDISESAVQNARELHPEIQFEAGDLLKPEDVRSLRSKLPELDALLVKELMWYVLASLDEFAAALSELMPVGRCFVSQSFPDGDNYFGQEIFPNALSMKDFFEKYYDTEYYSIEKDRRYGNRELLYYVGRAR